DKVMRDVPLTDRAITQNGQGAIVAAVSTTPDAIGYVSIPALIPAVKAVSIDGVLPTAASVLAGTYPISRPFIYVTRQAPAGLIKAFIDFVMGAEGQAIIRMVGLVSPVTPR
ncbi:MAG TPA: phosphate-binding protein, partial [Clostridiales bacterium UBA8153]|nr:phosphate-binding protein [Clostridiales bacterium UBA8153]